MIEYILATDGTIWIPEVRTEPIKGNAVNVINTLQKGMRVKFDSFSRVDKSGSVVDFIVTKGSQQLLIGVWPMGFELSNEQLQRIDDAGRSYIAIHCGFLDAENVKTAVTMGSVVDEVVVGQIGRIYTNYWIYHAKHGWVYDKEQRKIRI